MQFKGSLYVSDQVILKRYKDKFKLTYLKLPSRQSGYEFDVDKHGSRDKNETKLDNNLSRAKQKIFEYAYCNEFEYFITLTLDKRKFNRYDLKEYKIALHQFLNNYSKKYHIKIEYVMVPEMHEDGAWHIHGLIKGIPKEDLISFDDMEKVPKDLLGQGFYNWLPYAEKFGFNSLGVIRSQEGVSKYITKYIKKSLGSGIGKEKNTYMVSKGLKKAVLIKKGSLSGNSDLSYDYENDYVKIKWLDDDKIVHSII